MQNCLAVILAAGRGSRMYPLSEESPKCLLPVANQPLIWYSVQLLERSGFQEAVVVVREKESSSVLEVLNQFGGVTLQFSLVCIPDSEDWGTADSLRHIRGKLKLQHSDVLVVSCDLITSVQVHLLMEFHSCHQSTLTCLFANSSSLQEEGSHRKQTSAVEHDVVALTPEHQLVYFAAQADLDDSLTFSRFLLKRHPHMRVSSRLTDTHLYLMRRWVLDYLAENRAACRSRPLIVFPVAQNTPGAEGVATIGIHGEGWIRQTYRAVIGLSAVTNDSSMA
ncbi:Translation initiation factor eIF-2B subunit gamma [Geodia barretti]|uniref:Translation initiation factor eIF2B subunit gamma n=1 Tax=Geodia barretti TaxID=519541 RepID=A0AA35RPB3_GEOBA|nr:Translation initiation factor eIF-2B subunit gamma [Geodia barretti]